MPTSPTTSFLAEITSGGSLPLTGERIPDGQLAYFRERLKGRVFSFIVNGFLAQQEEHPEITQASIARRLGRRPEQINRWLSGPSNMTLDTVSDFALAIYGGEPSLGIEPLKSEAPAQTLNERQMRSEESSQTPPSLDALRHLESDMPFGRRDAGDVSKFQGQDISDTELANSQSVKATNDNSPLGSQRSLMSV